MATALTVFAAYANTDDEAPSEIVGLFTTEDAANAYLAQYPENERGWVSPYPVFDVAPRRVCYYTISTMYSVGDEPRPYHRNTSFADFEPVVYWADEGEEGEHWPTESATVRLDTEMLLRAGRRLGSGATRSVMVEGTDLDACRALLLATARSHGYTGD